MRCKDQGSIGSTTCQCGYTLLELLVAITVATLLGGFVLVTYLGFGKQFQHTLHRSMQAQELVAAKIRVDGEVGRIYRVRSCTHTRLVFDSDVDSNVVLELINDKLFMDERLLVASIKHMQFELRSLAGHETGQVLLWEVSTGAGEWIGGAKLISGAGQ
jgi:prepilin-type N-terminal cleavage/methylation domain-containing protein